MKKTLLLLLLLTGLQVSGATQYYPWYMGNYEGRLDSVRFLVIQDTTLSDSLVAQAFSFPTTAYVPFADTCKVSIVAVHYWDADSTAYPFRVDLDNSAPLLDEGDGSADLIFLALDTTGADSNAIEGVRITIANAAGATVGILETNGAGLDTATLVTGDAYTFTGYGPAGYVWHGETIASMAAGTDTMLGYNYLPSASPSGTPSKSTIYSWLYTAEGDSLYGAEVTATRDECATAVDSGGNVIISPAIASTSTNTTGYWALTLVNSGVYSEADCGYYTFTATYNKETVFKTRALWITGGFNLADSIYARP